MFDRSGHRSPRAPRPRHQARPRLEGLEERSLLTLLPVDSLATIAAPPVSYQGMLYYTADDGVHGEELWRSDGTPAGTALVKDLNPGSGPSSPSTLTVVGPTVYFAAYEPTGGYELWRSDGTAAGTALVKDIAPGTASS